jgi:cytochrome c biogenesis protein CcdA/thiol-disulfide isomerase/thioredoxin
MSILVPIAFAAGVITVFTPCILPVLPIILAGGTTGSKRRPYAIVAGLVTTFTVFTLAGAWVFQQLHLPERWQIRIGALLLLVAALTLILPRAGALLERPFAFLSRRRVGDLGSGYLLGASLGLDFVPCAGPVLAAVSANVGRHRVGVETVFVALAYAVGAALPMLAIARGSRRLAESFRAHARTLRLALGALMAVTAILIYDPLNKGWVEHLQTSVPAYIKPVQDALEGNGKADRELSRLKDGRRRTFTDVGARTLPPLAVASRPVKVALNDYGLAPNFLKISHWLNTPGEGPLTIRGLRGKVVLVDFWTYSCINCLRTLPYLADWDKRYRGKGLVIVGVHTPEFGFEHDLGNVRRAIDRLGVRYPVALDTDYGTWEAYSNQYWPADYLVDQTGHVRHVHVGEGDYRESERLIRLLLRAGGDSRLPVPGRDVDRTPRGTRTPETYLGYFRLERFDSDKLIVQRPHDYRLPTALPRDHWAYGGTWTVESERAIAGDGARLQLHFHARKVHLVLGGKGVVAVALDGKTRGVVRVNGSRLYTLVSQRKPGDGKLDLYFTPGVSAYAFTFG